MAGATAKLVVDLILNDKASKALSGISSDVKQSTNTLSKVGGIAKGALAVIGTGVIVDQIMGIVDAASDMNETVSKSKTVFGDAFPAIEKYVANSVTQIGMSKQAALDAASTFAIFGKSAGLSGDKLSSFSTDLVGLAADLASFHNTSPEQAIEAIGSAMRGEMEPIRAYGVLLDDASLRAKALEMGLISTTKDALDPATKSLAAQALMFDKTTDAQGDFLKTSDGLAGQQKIMAARFEDTKVMLGDALLPVFLDVATFMNETLAPAFKSVIDYVKENGEVFKPLAIGVGVLTAAIWLLNIAMSANPVVLIIAAVGIGIFNLVMTLLWLWNNWELFRNFLTTFVEGLKVVWAWIAEQAPKIGQWFGEIWATVQPILADIWGMIQETFVAVWDAVFPVLVSVWQAVQTAFGFIVEAFHAVVEGVPKVWKAFQDLWAIVQPVLAKVWGAVQTAFGFIVEKANDLWQALQRAWEGIQPGLDSLRSAFTELWTVVGPVLSAIGTAFMWLWTSAIQPTLGFIGEYFQWLWGIIQPVIGFIGEYFVWLWGIMQPILALMWEKFTEIAGVIGTVLVVAFQVFAGIVQWAWNMIAPVFNALASQFQNVVTIVTGLLKGLAAVVSWLATTIIGPLFGWIADRIRDWWTVVSTVFGWVKDAFFALESFIRGTITSIAQAGRSIWDWVWNGIESGINFVKGLLNGLIGFVTGIFNTIKNVATGAWDTVVSGFRNLINNVIRGWNNLSFSIPGFKVPGTDIGWDGFTLNLPDIPYLAAGGIVRTPTVAMIGERGAEAVIPLDRFLQTGQSYNVQIRIETKGLGADAPEIGREVVAAFRNYVESNGPVRGIAV